MVIMERLVTLVLWPITSVPPGFHIPDILHHAAIVLPVVGEVQKQLQATLASLGHHEVQSLEHRLRELSCRVEPESVTVATLNAAVLRHACHMPANG